LSLAEPFGTAVTLTVSPIQDLVPPCKLRVVGVGEVLGDRPSPMMPLVSAIQLSAPLLTRASAALGKPLSAAGLLQILLACSGLKSKISIIGKVFTVAQCAKAARR
jgi:hypothetical protein